MSAIENQKKFLQWLASNNRLAYRAAVNYARLQDRANGMGTIAIESGSSPAAKKIEDQTITAKLMSAVEQIVPALTAAYTTDRVLKAQLDLAKRGLPPMTTAQYSPTVTHNIELSEEGENSAKRIAEHAMGKLGMKQVWPFLAVGGILLFMFLKMRR